MIFIVCKYERWCKHWFTELASRYDEAKVNPRKLEIKVNGRTIRFTSEHRFFDIESRGLKDGTGIIYWEGDDINELEERIMMSTGKD